MDNFLNEIKARASQLDQGWGQPRLGIVSSVDPRSCMARVRLQPENVMSGWLPITSIWVGNGWGLACLPVPGDQVLILWQEGNAEHGFIVARLWSNNAKPLDAPVGEFWIVHQSGSFLKLCNDGSISSSAATWKHTGDFQASGDIADRYGSLDLLRNHYNTHVHFPSETPPTPID